MAQCCGFSDGSFFGLSGFELTTQPIIGCNLLPFCKIPTRLTRLRSLHVTPQGLPPSKESCFGRRSRSMPAMAAPALYLLTNSAFARSSMAGSPAVEI